MEGTSPPRVLAVEPEATPAPPYSGYVECKAKAPFQRSQPKQDRGTEAPVAAECLGAASNRLKELIITR